MGSLREEIESEIDDWLQDIAKTVEFVEQYIEDAEELDRPMDEEWHRISSKILALILNKLPEKKDIENNNFAFSRGNDRMITVGFNAYHDLVRSILEGK